MLYRVTTFTYELLNVLKSGDCSPDLVYYPGQDAVPYMTAEDKYIYGRESIISVADFRAGASRHFAPPPITGGATPSGALPANGDEKAGAGGKTEQKSKPKEASPTVEASAGSAITAGTSPKPGETAAAKPNKEMEKTAATEDRDKKKKKDGVVPDPAPTAKLGTDATAAAVNLDHRAAEAAT